MVLRDPVPLFVPLLLASLLLASSCTPQSARWSQVEAPKENTVDFVTLTHQVDFAPGTTVATAAQRQSLADFLDEVKFGYGDQLTLDTGPARGDATLDALAAKRIAAVAAMLRDMHIAARRAPRPTVDGALAHNAVVVSVGRYVVTGPRCPDWSKPEGDDYTNTPASNFGCATATNLGAMVANPADLLRGTNGGTADPDFVSRGIQRYRSGEISKSLQPELSKSSGSGNSGSGSGSDSGSGGSGSGSGGSGMGGAN
ncbi:MAG TPA: CpaD family pilus assembly lipoprotein [Alphaproteobacteria bacterium]|nr:CpaD family pilus assembly lipoprotein [Alphaproteobacteria bacterium]